MITLVLGVWGFTLAQPQNSLADHFYRSLQLFVLEFGEVAPPIPAPLEVARLAAPMLTVTSAAVAAITLSRNRIDAWRARRQRGHVVVCGLDRFGVAAAVALRRAGHTVVAVGPAHDAAEAAVHRCRAAGIPVVLGDPTSRDALARAGTATADHVVVLTRDLELAGTVALAAIDLPEGRDEHPLTVHLEIGRPQLATLLRAVRMSTHAAASWRIEELDLSGVGARTMLDAVAPWPPAATSAEVVVVGRTPLADAVALEARRRWARGGLRRDALVVTRGAEAFGSTSVPTAAYVCIDDDTDALAAALTLAQHHPDLPVLVHLEATSALGELVHRDSPGLHVIRLDESTLTPAVLLDSTVERVARALHDAYRSSAPPTDASAVAWEQLPESLRQSNRAQGEHVADKLRSAGCVLVPDDGTAPDRLTPEEVERLGVLEHERWVHERLAAGWTPGPRDPVARTTPYLVPWEDLDERVRDLDRQFIRALPGILADAGLLLRRVGRPPGSPDATHAERHEARSG